MKLTTQQETEIIEAYKDFWVKNLSADMEAFSSCLVDDFSIFGSAVGETFFNKYDAVDFYAATAEDLKGKAQLRNRNISLQAIQEHTVVVLELCDLYVLIADEWTFYGHARISCVMEKNDGSWKAIHQHVSFPDHRTEEGQQLAAEKIEKENLELREAVQRRTVELQAKNRELEIEAAVERVRAQSMAMQQTEDIAKVNKELFAQLTRLNIDGFTGVAIYLFDEKDEMTVWDLSSPGSISDPSSFAFKFDAKAAPLLGEFVSICRSETPDYFILDYPKEKLITAMNELQGIAPVVADAFKNAIESGVLEHQWNSSAKILNGMLSLDLMKAPTEEAKNITLKMAAAFNLAYQRFHDLQNAEAQTKESQIQLALERVRAKTMAMHQSTELADTASILFQQIKDLGFETWSCGFCIWKDDTIVESWMGADSGGLLPPLLIPYQEEKTHHDIFKSKQNGAVAYDRIWEGRELEEHYGFLATIPSVKEALDMMKSAGLTLPDKQCYYVGFFKKGYLLLITKEANPALKEISQRFAQAFDLTYTRFLDLQKAEAQTKEAQLELSLERIRAKVTAMKVSADLLDIVVTMRTEFVALGHQADYFWHMRWQKDIYEKAMTAGDGTRIGNVMTLPRSIHQNIPTIAAWEKTKEPTFVYAMDADAAVDYVIKMVTLGEFERVDPNAPTLDDIRHIGGLTFIMARTTHGEIGFSLPGNVSYPPEAAIATLVRFAAVFDLAYRRFEDLKSSEKQIREAKIELALERVRARTMAMQHSDELADASMVLDTQVRSLGIQTRGCAFNIYGENESTEWFSSEGGMMPIYKTPREDFFLRAYNADKSGEQLYIEEFAGEDCKAHYEYLCTIPVMGDALKGMMANGFKFPERQIDHAAFFKYGYVLFITLDPVPDAHEVFIRFAKVFEQTYTRFLDLQKSEAQTLRAEQDLLEIKEARQKAEETLLELQATQKQLIQSEKMASLGELTAGIAHEIQNPLNFVNNFSEVNKEMVDEVNEELDNGNIEEARSILNDIKDNSQKINHHGKRADAIVKGMLQHSQSNKGKKEPADINALADEYLRLAYHGLRAKDKSFNATLKTDFDESIGKINIIPQDIGRVLLNLITNAFYAVGEKSKTLSAVLTPTAVGDKNLNFEPTVSIKTSKIENRVQVTVSDNGNGIPNNIIDKIFQPFFTTKPTGQGTGLGLSLAYDIVKAHGGELEVETKEGCGTTFIIQLRVTS